MAVPIDPTEEPRVYQQTLLQDGLYDLLENDKLVDCTLKIKGKEFPCHRLVLAACSSFFRAIFLSDIEESKKREIVLDDVEPGVMGMILKYLYTSNINVTEQNVQDIFKVANLFQIPSIFTLCISFLQKKLSLSNCMAIFRLGLMLDCPRLAISARDFICEHFQLILQDDDFQQLSSSELAAIISCDALNVQSEEAVYEALINWVDHSKDDRIKDLVNLLDCVRFRLISPEYFVEKVEKNQWIKSNLEIMEKLQLVKDAYEGKLPEVKKLENKKSKENSDEAGEDEGEEQQDLLLGMLNDNLRFGMFLRDLMLMISDTGTMAYDPTDNECYVASLSTQIPKNHCSLVTKENQVFVVGGLFYNEENKEEPMNSYFLQFDPKIQDWIGMPPVPSARCLFGLGEADNSIFVIGGKELKERERTLDSVLIYDRRSFKWEETEPLPYSVYGHATVSHDGLVYIIGGKRDDKKCLQRVCMYDTKMLQWNELAPLRLARCLFGATVHNNKIFVAAGVTDSGLTSSTEVYDIASNTWSDFVEFPQERSSLCLLTVAGCLYAAGGFAMKPSDTSDELIPTEVNDIWKYEEGERKWRGILRNIDYAAGATMLGARLNILHLTKI